MMGWSAGMTGSSGFVGPPSAYVNNVIIIGKMSSVDEKCNPCALSKNVGNKFKGSNFP